MPNPVTPDSFIHPGTPKTDLPCSACGQNQLMVLPYWLITPDGVSCYEHKLVCFCCHAQTVIFVPANHHR